MRHVLPIACHLLTGIIITLILYTIDSTNSFSLGESLLCGLMAPTIPTLILWCLTEKKTEHFKAFGLINLIVCALADLCLIFLTCGIGLSIIGLSILCSHSFSQNSSRLTFWLTAGCFASYLILISVTFLFGAVCAVNPD